MISDFEFEIWLGIFLFCFGIFTGIIISEINSDVISKDVLNEVCSELYGENYFYEEDTFITPETNSFICKYIKPIPEVKTEIKLILIKENI